MKKIYLYDILKAIDIRYFGKDVLIRKVKDNINKLSDNTVIFHLNKDVEIDHNEFKKYKDCYIITDQPVLKNYINKDKYIYVDNINKAYSKFINYYRNLFKTKVVAVTGTCGKTTTKEMIAQVLKNKYKVVSTIGSKNNLRFHHDYLMKFNDDVKYGVFETAITHPGHLILDCEFFKPDIGIITNVGIDHLNWCKSLNNYIRTKAELLVGLKNKGHLLINNDDLNIKKIDFSHYKGKIITFGLKNNSNYFGKDTKQFKNRTVFTLVVDGVEYYVEIPTNGIHNVYNALASIACLDILGFGIGEAIYYLAKYIPIRSHTEVKEGINNSIIIDDTWSSNPTSMASALDVLCSYEDLKTKIAVLGKISYLGKYRDNYYKKIALMIKNKKIDYLVTIDDDSKDIANYAINYGMDKNKVLITNSKNDLYLTLNKILNKNTVALFKTSMLDKSSQEIIKELTK